MSPNLVWPLVISYFNALWHFFVVPGLSRSLHAEWQARGWATLGSFPLAWHGQLVSIGLLEGSVVWLVHRFYPASPWFSLDTIPLEITSLVFGVLWIWFWVRIANLSAALKRGTVDSGQVAAEASEKAVPGSVAAMIGGTQLETSSQRSSNAGMVEGSEVSDRIERLVHGHLVKVGDGASGWETLYVDPTDGRLWELTHPHGEMHGDGPPRLGAIDEIEANDKYQAAITAWPGCDPRQASIANAAVHFAFLGDLDFRLVERRVSSTDLWQLTYEGPAVRVTVEYHDWRFEVHFEHEGTAVDYLLIDRELFGRQSDFSGGMFPPSESLLAVISRIATDIESNYRDVLTGDERVWTDIKRLAGTPRPRARQPW